MRGMMIVCLLVLIVFIFLPISVAEGENNTIEVILTTILDEEVYLGVDYTKLFKIVRKENTSCPKNAEDVLVYYNITIYNSTDYNITEIDLIKQDNFTKNVKCSGTSPTGEFTPNQIGNYRLCGTIDRQNVSCMNFTVINPITNPCNVSLEFEMNDTLVYDEEQSVKFKPILNDKTYPYIIEYWIEDLFGEVVKTKINTTNTNQKSWKTDIDEEDRVLFVKGIVYPSCNDTDKSDNFVERMFIVLNPFIETFSLASEETNISIIKTTPEIINFGEILKVDVEVYKNSTNKYAFTSWVEKDGDVISEKTKFNLKTKNTNYKLTLPLQINPNCDGKIEDGVGMLIVEGLDVHVEKEINLAGINAGLCKGSGTNSGSSSSDVDNDKLTYEIINLPVYVISGEEFKFDVRFSNDNQEHNFEVWSYLYRGSKCYSCLDSTIEREENLQEFSLSANEEKIIKFILPVDEGLTEGEYKLKIKIRKDEQKTLKELTESITIEIPEVEEDVQKEEIVSETLSTNPFKSSSEYSFQKISKGSGIIVYEDNSSKAKRLIPYLIGIAFGLLILILVRKN